MNVALSDFEQYITVEDKKLCPQGCDLEYYYDYDEFRFCPKCGAKLIEIKQIVTKWRIKCAKPLSAEDAARMIQQHFNKVMKRAIEQSPSCYEKLLRRT